MSRDCLCYCTYFDDEGNERFFDWCPVHDAYPDEAYGPHQGRDPTYDPPSEAGA